MPSEQEFRTFLTLSSIPLRQLSDGFPLGISSGCLVQYGGRHWLLTVAHSTGNMGDWAIEVGYENGRGTKLYRLGPMNFVLRGDLSNGMVTDLDMAYVQVPVDLQPRWQPTNEHGEIVSDEPRVVLRTDLLCQPRSDQQYGFAGNVQPTDETHRELRYLGTTVACYTGLRFTGNHEDFYLFSLPSQRPSNDLLKGTSGSPLCDIDGNLVALVCGPGDESHTIRGIKVSYFRKALDVEVAGPDGD